MINSFLNKNKQKGAALLIFMMLFVVLGSSMLLKSLNIQVSDGIILKDKRTLNQAKDALLGYALRYADLNSPHLPGYLPCPDTNGDGLANKPCGTKNKSSIGRLPWKTLGLSPLRDSAGECLWYLVSGAYKELPKGHLSSKAKGQFLLYDDQLRNLNGSHLENAAIAIVFAPGQLLNKQNRSYSSGKTECGSKQASAQINQSKNYLDSFSNINNANGSYSKRILSGKSIRPTPSPGYSAFINTGEKQLHGEPVFNDSLLAITPPDYQNINKIMQQWISNRVKSCFEHHEKLNPGIPPPPPTATGNIPTGAGVPWPADPLQPSATCFSWSWWLDVNDDVFYTFLPGVTPADMSRSWLKVNVGTHGAVIFIAR